MHPMKAGVTMTLNLVVAFLMMAFAGSLLLSFRSAGQAVRLRKVALVNQSELLLQGQQDDVGDSPEVEDHFPPKAPEVLAAEAEVREQQREVLQSASFLLVTAERPDGCKTQEGCQLIMRSYKNKVDYCNLHGCKVWFSLETWEESLPGTWARYPLLRSLMDSNPDVPWFMWMDADAVFTNMAFSPPLEEFDRLGKNFILTGWEDKIFVEEADWTGLNAGVFIIRNCAWSKAFLDKWMAFGNPEDPDALRLMLNREMPNRPPYWNGDDQSSLVHILRENRRTSPEDDAATLLETSYGLHGYWVQIVPQLERWQARGNTADQPWPPVTHFVGCKLCSGDYASFSAQECFHNFHRAFTFADNQVLALSGMRHVRLGKSRVQRLPPIS